MNRLTVGCMGKLPCHAEFIRVAASTPEALALDQFFQEGLAIARKRGGAPYEQQYLKSQPILIYWRGKGKRVLVAASVSSRDAAGRLFPFTIFLVLEMQSGLDILPRIVEPFCNEALSLLARHWVSSTEVESAVQQLGEHLDLQENSPDSVGDPVLPWLVIDLANTLDNLLAVKASLDESTQGVLDYGLGLPLHSSPNPASQISFSIALVRRALATQPVPAAVLIRTQAPGAVIIFHGQPLPVSFGGLLGDADISEPVFWLHKQPSGNSDSMTAQIRKQAEQLFTSGNWTVGNALALI